MTDLGSDNFNRSDNASSWGTASDGKTYTVYGSGTASIVSNKGKLKSDGSDSHVQHGTYTSNDYDITFKMKIGDVADIGGIVARYTHSSSDQSYKLLYYSGGLHINRRISGANSELATGSFTATVGTEYNLRFQIIGTALKGKIWTGSEPGSWTVQTTDSSISSGGFAFLASTTGPGSIIYDDLLVTDAVSSTTLIVNITEQLTTFSAETYTTEFEIVDITEQITAFSADASVNGQQTIDEQLTTFSSDATTTSSIGFPNTPGISVVVGDSPPELVRIVEGTVNIDDQISGMTTASLVIRDDTGVKRYSKSQRIIINDNEQGIIFTGVISRSDERNLYPNPHVFSAIDAQGNDYFAFKRAYMGPEFFGLPSGAIFAELLNTLKGEGVTAKYASKRETLDAQLAIGTHTNTVAAKNIADGNIELAPAGTAITVHPGNIISVPGNGLLLHGEAAVSGSSTLYHYRKIWTGSVTLNTTGTFDKLQYEIWIAGTSPQAKAGVDLGFSDGTFLRTYSLSDQGTDAQGMNPTPEEDLLGLAVNKWYLRFLGFSAALHNKTITSVSVGVEGDEVGPYDIYFRNIKLIKGTDFSTKATFFNDTLLIDPSPVVRTSGYKNTSLSVVGVFNAEGTVTDPPVALDAIGIIRDSYISWDAIEPDDTHLEVYASIDNGNTWQKCTNKAPIPTLLAGMSCTGKTLKIQRRLSYTGNHPIYSSSSLNQVYTINPSYATSKSDVVYAVQTEADFNAGTYNNTVTYSGGGGISLNGISRNYDTGNQSNQTQYTNGGIFFIRDRQLIVQADAAKFNHNRCTFLGSRQNCTIEANIKVLASGQVGILYRTTGWQATNEHTYAYAATVSTTQVKLARGTNTGSGGGAETVISTASISLTDGDYHRIKVTANGNSHIVYLDGVEYINTTDSTYSSSGEIGITYKNTSGATDKTSVDEIGAVSSETGTWTSPSVDLSAASTYGSSVVWLADEFMPESASYTLETSIDGGSTWQPTGQGGAISNLVEGQSLSGVSLKLRLTLSTSNIAGVVEGSFIQTFIDAITVIVVGGYNASGYRISTPLSLLPVERLGNSLISWKQDLPADTTVNTEISLDGGLTWHGTLPGGNIPGMTPQPGTIFDSFDVDSYGDYMLNTISGTPAFIIASSKISATGGNGIYIHNGVQGTDIDLYADLDNTDSGGLIWRYSDTNNYYELVVQDGSSSGAAPDSIALYKVASGSRTLLSSSAISAKRGNIHRYRVRMEDINITAYMDGVQKILYTDAGALAGGQAGISINGGQADFYQVWLQALGEDVSDLSLQVKTILSSRDPRYTPRVYDILAGVYGTTIGLGSIVPETAYNLEYISNAFDDLSRRGDYYWNVDKDKNAVYLPREAKSADWVAQDVFLVGVTIKDESDLYRNRQIIKNVIETVDIDDKFSGDGTRKTFSLSYSLASKPIVTVDGMNVTIGSKGADTGRAFYYAIGDNALTQDDNDPPLVSNQMLEVLATGQKTTYSQYDDPSAQAIIAAMEGGSGIVENVEDGNGISKVAADALARSRVERYRVRGKVLNARTRKAGLEPGMLLSVHLPEHGIIDGLFLVRNVKTTYRTQADESTGQPTQRGWYDIEAVSGPDIGSWTQLFAKKQALSLVDSETGDTIMSVDVNLKELNGTIINTANPIPVSVKMPTSSSTVLTNVAASTSAVTILVADAATKGVIIYNDSSAALYIKYGLSASNTSFTYKISGGSNWEMTSSPVYTGIITGVWDTATGDARVTKLV
jgi:hypothetical protein